LGYKISYFPDKFEFMSKSNYYSFSGNIVFNEDLAITETDKQRFERIDVTLLLKETAK